MSMNTGSFPTANVQQSTGVSQSGGPGQAGRLNAVPAGTAQVAEAQRTAPKAGTGQGLDASVRNGSERAQQGAGRPPPTDTTNDRTKRTGPQGASPMLGIGY